jgi:hypothetical protein
MVTSSLPYWIQVLQALLTPAIAALAVVIALFQWRTAKQKVVLDLFDRRLAKYVALRQVVAKVTTSGAATSENETQYRQALDGIDFLFGSDIVGPLSEISKAIGLLSVIGPERQALSAGPELTALVKQERQALDVVGTFYSTVYARFQRYMHMHEKAPLPLREYFVMWTRRP